MTVLLALLSSADESHAGGVGRRPVQLFDYPEPDIIKRLRVDDERVYAHVYAVLAPRLMAIAEGYVPAAVAEEIAQDALLYLWDGRATWPVERGIAAYLYTVVRHRALDQARRSGMIDRVAVSDADAPPGAGMGPERPDTLMERRDLAASITRALSLLPEQRRTAFTLRWIHQLGYPEISTIMAISEIAARKHVSRARESLIIVLRAHVPG